MEENKYILIPFTKLITLIDSILDLTSDGVDQTAL